MMILAVLLAGLAAGLAWAPARRLPTSALPRTEPVGSGAGGSRGGATGAVAVAGLLGVGVIWWLLGGRAGALAGVAVILLGTLLLVIRGRRREARVRRRRGEVARAAELLAAEMSLGKVPSAALAAAGADAVVLAPAAAAARIGAEVPGIWRRQATESGYQDLAALSRAWQVAGRTGAPLGPSLRRVAEGLRVEEELRRTVAGELAAPRMTGVVLSLLPLAGLTIGFLIGGDPLDFLTGTPWGRACLLAGTLLAAAGLLWTERLGSVGGD